MNSKLHDINMSPVVGQIWESTQGEGFRVTEVQHDTGKTWVYYTNVNNLKNYSCYKESFINRFYLQVNKN